MFLFGLWLGQLTKQQAKNCKEGTVHVTDEVNTAPESNRRLVVQQNEAHAHVIEQSTATEPGEDVEQVVVLWRHEPLLEALIHISLSPDAWRTGKH